MTFTQRKMLGFVAGCTVVITGVTGCTAAGSTGATGTPTPAASAATSPSAAASPVADGCPPDVNLLFEWLKDTPAIVNEIDKSLTGIEEPTCYQGWAVARTVVKNADSLLVLFKLEPETGKWAAVAVGSDGVCDGTVKVPEAIQAKLGAGC